MSKKEKETQSVVGSPEVAETTLQDKEQALQEKEQTLQEREIQIEQREKRIQAAEEKLEKEQRDFDKSINSQYAELEKREKQLAEKQESVIGSPQVAEKGFAFDFEGERYQFRDDAPKKIIFNGKSLSQEELAKDEDAILQLLGGNLGLINKI